MTARLAPFRALELSDIHGLDPQLQISEKTRPRINIIITSHGDFPITVCAMNAGAMEALTKPIAADSLMTTISIGWPRDRIAQQHLGGADKVAKALSLLSPREREVLPLVVAELLSKQATATHGISELSLQVHGGQIPRKMIPIHSLILSDWPVNLACVWHAKIHSLIQLHYSRQPRPRGPRTPSCVAANDNHELHEGASSCQPESEGYLGRGMRPGVPARAIEPFWRRRLSIMDSG